MYIYSMKLLFDLSFIKLIPNKSLYIHQFQEVSPVNSFHFVLPVASMESSAFSECSILSILGYSFPRIVFYKMKDNLFTRFYRISSEI